jgi:hypothetical protein
MRVVSFWSRLFGGGKVAPKGSPYDALRSQVLTLKPEALGPEPAGAGVHGVVMETGYPEAVVTLVAIADGTVSLYFSNGGGMIGLGAHAGPRNAGLELISKAASFLGSMAPAKSFPLPAKGATQFYVLTREGPFTAGARGEDLGLNRHPLSPLFHAAQEVITQARLSSARP